MREASREPECHFEGKRVTEACSSDAGELLRIKTLKTGSGRTQPCDFRSNRAEQRVGSTSHFGALRKGSQEKEGIVKSQKGIRVAEGEALKTPEQFLDLRAALRAAKSPGFFQLLQLSCQTLRARARLFMRWH